MNFPDKMPTFSIKTLGCKVNQYETQLMRERLDENGFEEVSLAQEADYFIINSCTVTHKADRDTRNLINHFHRVNPAGKIIVAGCYTEMKKDRDLLYNLPGVTSFVPNREKENIAEILKAPFLPKTIKSPNTESKKSTYIKKFKGHNRAFIKIQDGCNHRCSYCKVSLVRGKSISRNEHEILKEIKKVLSVGFQEIVLTGICLGAWGYDISKETSLSNLLERISNINGNFRIRLSSIEPLYVTDRLIELVCDNKKVCKHLHIPLQSGDDKVLMKMNRPYKIKDFSRLVKKIRRRIPEVAITTDILLGFHGEDEKSFKKTIGFIKKIKPSRIHIFSYSKREGTPAANYTGALDNVAIKERMKKLSSIALFLQHDFAKKFIGKKETVLVENKRERESALLTGYTDHYVRAFLDGPDSLKNRIVTAKIIGFMGDKSAVLALP